MTGNYLLLRPCERPSEELGDLLSPPEGSRYIDLGAYNGDTVLFYSGIFPQIRSILAVEPDKRNFRKLTETVRSHFPSDVSDPSQGSFGKASVSCIRALISDRDGTAFVPRNRGRGVHETDSSEKGEELTAVSLVTLLQDQKADLIKMDVEGFEREALWGAARTIRRCSPKLAVAVYHRNEDIFELPLLIKRLNPKYKLYLRHKLYIPAWETNLYAIPE